MDQARTVETAYGTVDAAALRELKGGFATADLLKAADDVEVRRMWLRDNLRRLHGMARHLLDGDPQSVTAEEPIWQLAEEIADELEACVTDFAHTITRVDRLARLRPPDH